MLDATHANSHDLKHIQTVPMTCLGLLPNFWSKPVCLTLYIPDCDSVGKEINVAFWIAATCQLFAHSFGGASVSPAHRGYWQCPDTGGTIKERTFKVSVFAEPVDIRKSADLLNRYIRRFGRETNQGEVLVTLDDQVLRYTAFT